MKKVVYLILDILSLAFLAGGYLFQYYAKRKLGMMRWVNFQTTRYQKQMPVDLLKYAAAAAALLLLVIMLLLYRKKRDGAGRADAVMAAAQAVLVIGYVGFTVWGSLDKMRTYYLVMPMIGAAVLMLTIRNAIALGTCKSV